VEYGDVVYAIAESRTQKGLIWAGTNDGLVQVTRDGGKNWSNVTANLPGIPTLGSVRHIEPSRYDAGTAYLIVDAHQENNRDPWVYRTNDFGKTWKLIVDGLPRSPVSYAHIIREDPVRRGLLYLGTESALHVSFDDGEHWQPMQANLPPAPVYGLVIQEHFNDLVVATYGRGFWIMDDLGPLQKLTPEVTAEAVHLFPMRASYRFRDINGNVTMSDDPTAGANPVYGADINYFLKSVPAATPTIAILDAEGKTVRTMQGTQQRGLNRVYWDLRNDATKTPRMRTKPMNDVEFTMDPDGTRAAPGFGTLAVLMPPGRYTVKLTVDGRAFTTPLDVRKDPNEAVSEQEIQASTDQLVAAQADLNNTVEVLNTTEVVRAQIVTLQAQLLNDRNNADIKTQADALEQKMLGLVQKIIDPRLTGRGQDEVRYPAKAGAQLNYLANGMAASDYTPTAQQREVNVVLDKQVKDNRATFDQLIARDLAALNDLLKKRGLKPIDITVPPVVF
jgi:hypothetical protein